MKDTKSKTFKITFSKGLDHGKLDCVVCFGVTGCHLSTSSLGARACAFIEGGRDCVSVLYVITDLLRMRPAHSNVCYCLLVMYRRMTSTERAS